MSVDLRRTTAHARYIIENCWLKKRTKHEKHDHSANFAPRVGNEKPLAKPLILICGQLPRHIPCPLTNNQNHNNKHNPKRTHLTIVYQIPTPSSHPKETQNEHRTIPAQPQISHPHPHRRYQNPDSVHNLSTGRSS